MTYAPIGWGIALVFAFSYLKGALPESGTPQGAELTWVMPLLYAINVIALFLARYVSTFPGRFLPLPYKSYWLANSHRQDRYFRVTLTVSWVVVGLCTLSLASLVAGLTSTGTGTALGALGFLSLNVVAFSFALFWPTKMLKPATLSASDPLSMDSRPSQSFAKSEYK